MGLKLLFPDRQFRAPSAKAVLRLCALCDIERSGHLTIIIGLYEGNMQTVSYCEACAAYVIATLPTARAAYLYDKEQADASDTSSRS